MTKKTKYPRCPLCGKNDSVIRYGKRNNKIRYLCKICGKSFSKDFSHNKLKDFDLLTSHLDGISLRKLSENKKYPKATRIFEIISPIIKSFPTCLDITKSFCDVSKFSGKLVFDGTYVSVKGYKSKIPLIWGFDYDSHDIPHSMLVPSENYLACRKFFLDLKSVNYPLKYVVCDDNNNIKQAACDIFPNVVIQTCLKHYLKNISDDLGIKSSDKYKHFFDVIYDIVYAQRLCEPELAWGIQKIFDGFKNDEKQYFWLADIMTRRKELTNYHLFENCPNTTNLIEGFNGHLKDRINSIRGFKSFHSAKYWLNAYVLRRRTTKFKACNKKFKHLNGKTPIESTLRKDEEIPNIFN